MKYLEYFVTLTFFLIIIEPYTYKLCKIDTRPATIWYNHLGKYLLEDWKNGYSEVSR